MFRRLFPVLFVAAVVLPAVPAAAAPPSCGDTIVADTTLTANLLCLAGDGLTIGADGVELDLGGFAIIGSPAVLATGVQATGVSDFVIRNGTVRGFDKAIVFDTATDGCSATCRSSTTAEGSSCPTGRTAIGSAGAASSPTATAPYRSSTAARTASSTRCFGQRRMRSSS